MSDQEKIKKNCDDDIFVSLGELSIYEKIIWKFPKTNICPLDECEQSFSNPTNCVEHFCQRHAVTAMLCSVCNQIFSTEKLAAHYKVNHPDKDSPKLKSMDSDMAEIEMPNDSRVNDDQKKNEESPLDFDANKQLPKGTQHKIIRKSFAKEKSHDNLIHLYAVGPHGTKIVTKWYFPSDMKTCPVHHCSNKIFNTQSAAKRHYKQNHAMNAIYCCFCEKPVSALHFNNYIRHYKRLHKKIKNPFNFVENAKIQRTKEKCDSVQRIRRKPFSSRSKAKHNNKEDVQTKKFVSCGICNKRISAITSAYVTRHFRFNHPNQKVQLKQLNTPNVMNDIRPQRISTSLNVERNMNGMQHRPQKRVHRPIKSQHNLNARRIALSHRWRRRYYSRIFEKILNQTSRLVQKDKDPIQMNRNSEASNQISAVKGLVEVTSQQRSMREPEREQDLSSPPTSSPQHLIPDITATTTNSSSERSRCSPSPSSSLSANSSTLTQVRNGNGSSATGNGTLSGSGSATTTTTTSICTSISSGLQNVLENDAITLPNGYESDGFLLEPLIVINVSGGLSTEDVDTVCRNLKRRHDESDSNRCDAVFDENERTKQSKKQKMIPKIENLDNEQIKLEQSFDVIDLTEDETMRLLPSPLTSNFVGKSLVITTSKIENPTDIESEVINNLYDEKPLDLTKPKPLDLTKPKPIYILSSDEEADPIVIDSDDDEDNKKFVLKSMMKF